jgi:hypothetical protein
LQEGKSNGSDDEIKGKDVGVGSLDGAKGGGAGHGNGLDLGYLEQTHDARSPMVD